MCNRSQDSNFLASTATLSFSIIKYQECSGTDPFSMQSYMGSVNGPKASHELHPHALPVLLSEFFVCTLWHCMNLEFREHQ
jgi:hypothetical protein